MNSTIRGRNVENEVINSIGFFAYLKVELSTKDDMSIRWTGTDKGSGHYLGFQVHPKGGMIFFVKRIVNELANQGCLALWAV
jgi:hypothetical protein